MKNKNSRFIVIMCLLFMFNNASAGDNAPSEGSEAPNFKLGVVGSDPGRTFELSEFRGKKPVVLIFGSYT